MQINKDSYLNLLVNNIYNASLPQKEMGFWPVVLNVLKNSDIVLLVVDARMPEISRNSELLSKSFAMKKRLFIVFNKIDLIGEKDMKELKKLYPNALFVSTKTREGIKNLNLFLENKANNHDNESLRVGIVGYPNVGKSSLINKIVPAAKLKTGKQSGTTRKTAWIRKDKLRIMDSPGVIPFEDKKIEVGLTASKDPHKIKNPEKVAMKIIDFLGKRKDFILERFYKIEYDKNLPYNGYELFEAIAKKKKHLLKKGEIDEHRTAITIIEDWQQGKIKLK